MTDEDRYQSQYTGKQIDDAIGRIRAAPEPNELLTKDDIEEMIPTPEDLSDIFV